ncbi:MAG: hypothetical protein BWZ02_02637 [Lentisphaerae bacterium ADurb.BinA184]|nr:MAG: hypothetical protein BWZ02_02637 [Lentisphaerae bacterium ADurb.BinA184]
MNIRSCIASLAVASLLGAASLAAAAPPPAGGDPMGRLQSAMGWIRDYSVTVETTLPDAAGTTHASRMAQLAGKTRMDMAMPGMGEVAILHLPEQKDRNGNPGVSYILFPATKTYVETPRPQGNQGAAVTKEQMTIEELGKETLDAMVCDKRRIQVTDPETKQVHSTLVWTSPAVKNMPVKLETGEGGQRVVVRFRDYEFGKPDAALFVLPADYTVNTMMQVMMGQGAAGQAKAAEAAQEAGETAAGAQAAEEGAATGTATGAAEAAKDEAVKTLQDNVRQGVRDGINTGVRKLFGK